MTWRPWLLAATIAAVLASSGWILLEARDSGAAIAASAPTAVDGAGHADEPGSTPPSTATKSFGSKCEKGARRPAAVAPDSWAVGPLVIEDGRTHATVRYPRDWQFTGGHVYSEYASHVSIAFYSVYMPVQDRVLRWDQSIQLIEGDKNVVADEASPIDANACLVTGHDDNHGHFAAVIRVVGESTYGAVAMMGNQTSAPERNDALVVLHTFQPVG